MKGRALRVHSGRVVVISAKSGFYTGTFTGCVPVPFLQFNLRGQKLVYYKNMESSKYHFSVPVFTQGRPKKIIIIKADDLTGITSPWNRFFTMSEAKGVKVSAGIICHSLEGDNKDYSDWLLKLQATGWVEFWNHGWDHKAWKTEAGNNLSEFGGSGYDHQSKHYADARNIMKDALGSTPIAFGTPYNAKDADTVSVMNEDDTLRLFFCVNVEGLSRHIVRAKMNLTGEHDGTGKPNFEKFKAHYEQYKDETCSALQFHPNAFSEEHFAEYAKILDLLIADGWTFMLPTEYVAMVDHGLAELVPPAD